MIDKDKIEMWKIISLQSRTFTLSFPHERKTPTSTVRVYQTWAASWARVWLQPCVDRGTIGKLKSSLIP